MDISYNTIISTDNLLLAWKEFLKGKKNKKDVQEFQMNLMDNIISLQNDLTSKTYSHGGYTAFNISDPKPRNIHKATVRDRLLHHAIYRILYPYFDTQFIHDSYSCRKWKGTHRALNRFKDFGRKVSKNNTRQCWILKCDVRKFFASIDHKILLEILTYHILDKDTLWLLNQVISSFSSSPLIYDISYIKKGLPLGNLTSQLLVNIYMNQFDQYVKHRLHQKYYIRYADDFVFFSHNKHELHNLLQYIVVNLKERLNLTLHPNKIHIRTLSSGVDFLGWVHFPHHRVLRTVAKRGMLKGLRGSPTRETIQSCLGLLSHGDTYELRNSIKVWLYSSPLRGCLDLLHLDLR